MRERGEGYRKRERGREKRKEECEREGKRKRREWGMCVQVRGREGECVCERERGYNSIKLQLYTHLGGKNIF